MIFRQLYDQETSTYSYLLADEQTREAILIDPVIEQVDRDVQVIKELELTLKYILDTHVHADHITGAAHLKKHFPGARYALGEKSNLTCADILLQDNEELSFGSCTVRSFETPGHTDNSVTYQVEDMIFTGDALLIRGCGRTDFQSGSAEVLYNAVQQRMFSLPGATRVFPAHDYKGRTMSTIAEEQRWNPRLGGTTLEEFVHIMENLNLPYPKKIDESLPWNNKCGDIDVTEHHSHTVPQG